MHGGASILPLPPLAESQRRSKETGLFFSTLLMHTHTHTTPPFPQHSSAFTKRKTKNSFSPAHQSGGMGKQTWFPAYQAVNQTEPRQIVPTKISTRSLLSQTFPFSKCWSDMSGTSHSSHICWSRTTWLEALACAKTMCLQGEGARGMNKD